MERKYNTLMVISFIFGGFLLSAYLLNVYSIIWRHEFATSFQIQPLRFVREPGREQERNLSTTAMLTSPQMLFTLIGGLISIANGIAIRALTHTKEVKQIKKDLTELYLTAEEKQLMKEIMDSGGDLTQKELTEATGYSRVKIHRTLQKLESKKLIKKIPYGQTNKIIIKKEH